MKKLIDLYPYILDPEHHLRFLVLLRKSAKIYAGQWRMVGGKVKPGETYWQAALRELKEETSLQPIEFWTVPSVNSFYEYTSDMVHHIPAFAARLGHDIEIKLDEEHSAYKWITIDEVREHIFWPEQRRLMHLIHDIVSSRAVLEQWKIALG